MHVCARFLLFIFSLFSLTNFQSCGNTKGGRQRVKLNDDSWLVTGQISNDGYGGGEVLALALDGMRYRSRVDQNQAFAIQLPGNSSYALYFLGAPDLESEVSSGSDDIAAVAKTHQRLNKEALLYFEESPDIGIRNTLRLPKVLFNSVISLGQVDIKGDQAFPTINPSLNLDFDNDGINDFADLDDQNDGLSDLPQKQSTERIEICHFNEKDQGKTIAVSLSDLYTHVEDGDILGPCLAKDMRARIDASYKEIEVAPKSPAPPPQKFTPPAPTPIDNNPLPPKAKPLVDDDADREEHEESEDKDDLAADEDEDADSADEDEDSTEEDDDEEDEDEDDSDEDENPPANKKPVKKPANKRPRV